MKRNIFVCVVLSSFFTGSLSAQEVNLDEPRIRPVKLTLSVGALTMVDFQNPESIYSISIDWVPDVCLLPNPPRWCWEVRIETGFIDPRPDPWINPTIGGILPDITNPGFIDPVPFESLVLGDLEVGPGWMINPSVGIITPLRNDKITTTILLGGGVQYDQGRETSITDLGTFEVQPTTNLLVSYGANLSIALSETISAEANLKGITYFMDDLYVRGPDGSLALFTGSAMRMIQSNIGLGFHF